MVEKDRLELEENGCLDDSLCRLPGEPVWLWRDQPE